MQSATAGVIHDAKFPRDNLLKSNGRNELCRGVVDGVGAVDALHLGSLDHHVGAHLDGPQHGSRIGGEVGIAGATGENHHPLLLHVPERPSANVGLRHLFHVDGGHHTGGDSFALEEVLDGQGVDDGGEHAHVVRLCAVHALLTRQSSPDDVASPDHETQAHSHLVNPPSPRR